MQQDTIHEVDLTIVRGIEALLSRPSIPIGRNVIDLTLNKKRVKEVADKISSAILYLLSTKKIKREPTEDNVPKFWLSSREQPTDAEGRPITLVEGVSRQFMFRLMHNGEVIETNVADVGDTVTKRAPPVVKTMIPVPQNKETQDQLAAVMLQHGTPEQQREALMHAKAPTLATAMRDLADEVDAEAAEAAEQDDTDEEAQCDDDSEVIDDTPPVDAGNFYMARLKDLEGYRLDDQLVIATGFWQNPVKEQELIDFMVKNNFAKSGTIKLRLAHVVNVREELTRTERADGVYYTVGPRQVPLRQRPKTASYKPKKAAPASAPAIQVALPTAPAQGTKVNVIVDESSSESVFAHKAIEITESSKVLYLVDSNGALTINVSGINVLAFTPEAAAKMVHFASNVKGLYDI